ncbi:anaerobic ribonucleoside triphosphate reductase [Massilibacteroides sp.]|uniref:anaerobic ribonucleoside triphosphate reductase n=1 Tax=Massilibacteroides sp. TaxID=2034766 RepID=UPI00261B7526|nr:anaerobic ribonucleoside triphosphate reductase [Massilibacteroides sp.]MDD4515828.1 anaerobic ribonucleoside triphosphate reductase [Massilibacteroides sp.]
MNFSEITISKRDGTQEKFSIEKIKNAITKAFRASNTPDTEREMYDIALAVASSINTATTSVEQIQDFVEKELMKRNPIVAKKYIIYREWRNVERHKKTNMKHIMDGIVSIEKNDVNLSNANMSAHTPAGQMMTFASEITKDYAEKYLINPEYTLAHKNGDIHIHDLDYYPTKTTTCIQYNLEELFEKGFRTKNGSIRTPQSIQSYATLATIVFQTNQNEQHGGQSIPAFDFFMAKGVLKTFQKHLASNIDLLAQLSGVVVGEKELRSLVRETILSIQVSDADINILLQKLSEVGVSFSYKQLKLAINRSEATTRKETHQAMEGFIHNLNTMHSRGGNQVVFSSINYGTDTSPEGRMVIRELLAATIEGLGHGEVPVFPIQIFKVKEGVSFSENDYKLALEDFQAALSGNVKFEAPNFDLLLEACHTTSVALFPNFMFLDTPFNKHEKWEINDPHRYMYETATMGCRTRVFENLHGEKTSIGRGNLSFTSINMPRLAIEAKLKAETLYPDLGKQETQDKARAFFLKSIHNITEMVAEQLYDRYQYQRTALARQFPFMMGNNIWQGGGELKSNDEVADTINSGTLGIGFIGGHNAMVAIYGEGHAKNQRAYQTLYDAVLEINKVVDEYKEKYNLNYSVLATPAEGLSGRFTRIDRKKYGTITGVTDKDYYVNSFHVDVKEHVTVAEKIKLEAPFHAITRGGHITYVELDGEAKKNVSVILKIVHQMNKENIGYGSINHPVDTCHQCGYRGIIYAECPICKSEDIVRMRRITGYLTGSLESWNSAKQAEEKDRVKHV